MKRAFLVGPAVLASLAWLGGFAAASEERPAASKAKAQDRDPVASAFELPAGVRLAGGQKAAFEKIRNQYEPKLREAIDRIASAGDERAKRVRAREALRIRQEIRDEIRAILSGEEGGEGRAEGYPGRYEGRMEKPYYGEGHYFPYGYEYGAPGWYRYPVVPYPVMTPKWWPEGHGEKHAGKHDGVKGASGGDHPAGAKAGSKDRPVMMQPPKQVTQVKPPSLPSRPGRVIEPPKFTPPKRVIQPPRVQVQPAKPVPH